MVLLFSFLPFIGDPLTVVAGFFRYNFWRFSGYVLLSKLIRYALIYLLWMALVQFHKLKSFLKKEAVNIYDSVAQVRAFGTIANVMFWGDDCLKNSSGIIIQK